MKKLILTTLVVSVVAVAALIPTTEAFAQGGKGFGEGQNLEHRTEMLETKAAYLGISVEELTEAMENGTMRDLLDERGITMGDLWNSIKDTVIGNMRERGLSEDQIAERMEHREHRMGEMQEWRENNPDAPCPHHGEFGQGFGQKGNHQF